MGVREGWKDGHPPALLRFSPPTYTRLLNAQCECTCMCTLVHTPTLTLRGPHAHNTQRHTSAPSTRTPRHNRSCARSHITPCSRQPPPGVPTCLHTLTPHTGRRAHAHVPSICLMAQVCPPTHLHLPTPVYLVHFTELSKFVF